MCRKYSRVPATHSQVFWLHHQQQLTSAKPIDGPDSSKGGFKLQNKRCKKGITESLVLAGEEGKERHPARGRENPGGCIVRWGSSDSRISLQLSQVTAVKTAVISDADRARTTFLCGLFVFTGTTQFCTTSCCSSHS